MLYAYINYILFSHLNFFADSCFQLRSQQFFDFLEKLTLLAKGRKLCWKVHNHKKLPLHASFDININIIIIIYMIKQLNDKEVRKVNWVRYLGKIIT